MNNLTQDAIDLIKSFEGFEASPYQDSGGVWTQGYGNTHGVTADSPPVTQEQAQATLLANLQATEQAITNFLQVTINDNQFGALTSLVYNAGTAPLTGHLGQYINNGQFQEASEQFIVWNHVDGVTVPGLLNRREAERTLFLTPIEEQIS
jgi:lysozyme